METPESASVACYALSTGMMNTAVATGNRVMGEQCASHPGRVRQVLHVRDHRLPTLRHRSDSRIQSRSYPWQSRLYAEFGRSAISPGRRIDSPECQINRKSREGREIGRINASWRLPTSSDEPDIGIAGSGLTVREENMGTMLWGLWIRGCVCLVPGVVI